MSTLTAGDSAGSAESAAPSAARGAVSALFFLNGALMASWVARLSAVETGRGLTHAGLGLALLVIACGAVVAMPLAGMAGARYGTAAVCRIAAVLYAVMLPLLAVVPVPALWGVCLLLFGAGHGALDVAMNAQAAAVEAAVRRPVMSTLHACFSAGGLAGAAAGMGIAVIGIPAWAHFVSISAIVLGALVMLSRHLIPQAPRSGERRRRQIPWPGGALRGPAAIALCVMMGEGAVADWSAVYLTHVTGAGEGLAAAGYASFAVAMTAARLGGDALAGSRAGPVRTVAGSALLAGAGMLMVVLAPGAGMALVGFACTGAGFGNVIPVVFSAAGRLPGVNPGVALASVATPGYLGFLAGPPLIGFLADAVGLRAALSVIVVACVVAAVLAPLLKPRAVART